MQQTRVHGTRAVKLATLCPCVFLFFVSRGTRPVALCSLAHRPGCQVGQLLRAVALMDDRLFRRLEVRSRLHCARVPFSAVYPGAGAVRGRL